MRKTGPHVPCFMFLMCFMAAFPLTTYAYQQRDVTQIAAPSSGGIVLLRGYDSRRGLLMDHCLVPVKKTERGIGQPLSSNYRFVRSMEEVIRDRSLDVSTKLQVSLGIGGASLGVEAGFYKKNQSRIEQGAAHATFYDAESPIFSSSRAHYQLTNDAKALFQQSIKQGKFRKFARRCGDAVIVGTQRARFFQGMAFYSDKSSKSEEQRKLDIKAAASYMAVKLGLGVSMSQSSQEKVKKKNISVDYIASGDATLRGATNLRGFAKAFSQFQALPKHKTFDVVNIFTIPYEKLLATKEFDLGISGVHLMKVNRIIDGVNLIGRAKNSVSGDSKKAKSTRIFLTREYQYLTNVLRREKGCIDTFSVICQNLYDRFKAFPPAQKNFHLKRFVDFAVQSSRSCPTGYSISTPTGKAMCQVCSSGKEPRFSKRGEGRCDYLINTKKHPRAKRLFLRDLQWTEKRHIEAGVVTHVSVSPNYCLKPGRKCGKEAARAICQQRKFKDVSGFGLWRPALKTLSKTIDRIAYLNKKACQPKPHAFSPVKCMTFQWIDCTR